MASRPRITRDFDPMEGFNEPLFSAAITTAERRAGQAPDDPMADEAGRARYARQAGYSPEAAQIHARHNDAMLQTPMPRDPTINYERINEGTRLGVVADSRVNPMEIADNRNRQVDALDAMRSTRNLRDYAGQAMTQEEGDFRRQRLEGRSERSRMQGEDARRFDAGLESMARLENIKGVYQESVAKAEAGGVEAAAKAKAQAEVEAARLGQDPMAPTIINDPVTGAPVAYSPKSGQLMPMGGTPNPMDGNRGRPAYGENDELLGHFVRDGEGKEKFVAAKPKQEQPADPEAVRMEEGRAKERAKLLGELRLHQKKMASGDNRFGLANLKNRGDRVAEIEGQLEGLGGVPGAAPASAPAAAEEPLPPGLVRGPGGQIGAMVNGQFRPVRKRSN
jgi:hypothetical protein